MKKRPKKSEVTKPKKKIFLAESIQMTPEEKASLEALIDWEQNSGRRSPDYKHRQIKAVA